MTEKIIHPDSRLFESLSTATRESYQEKGHHINHHVQGALSHLQDILTREKFVIPLLPFHLDKVLKHSPKLATYPYGVTGGHSMSSMMSRDPVLGATIYQTARKIFFPTCGNKPYSQLFDSLNERQLETILTLILADKPIFSSYADLPHFQRHWEFSNVASYLTTRISRVLKLDDDDADQLFTAVLMNDIGKLLLYWEFPLNGLDQQATRCVNGTASIRVTEALFQELVWHWHPVLSARTARQLGMKEQTLELISGHHSQSGPPSRLMKLIKFTHRLTDHILSHTEASTAEGFLKTLGDINVSAGTELSAQQLTDLAEHIIKMNFDYLGFSIIPNENALELDVGAYDLLGHTNDFMLDLHSKTTQINFLQQTKDRIHKFLGNILLPDPTNLSAQTEKMGQIFILNTVYHAQTLQQAGEKLGMTESQILTVIKLVSGS